MRRRLAAGIRAAYLRAAKTVRFLGCIESDVPTSSEAPTPAPAPASTPAPTLEAVDSGSAGSSARREYARRSAKREAHTRQAHPRLEGLILALTDEPRSTTDTRKSSICWRT